MSWITDGSKMVEVLVDSSGDGSGGGGGGGMDNDNDDLGDSCSHYDQMNEFALIFDAMSPLFIDNCEQLHLFLRGWGGGGGSRGGGQVICYGTNYIDSLKGHQRG